jgi:hypothetical protein
MGRHIWVALYGVAGQGGTRRRRRVAALTRGGVPRLILGSGEVGTAVRHTPHSKQVRLFGALTVQADGRSDRFTQLHIKESGRGWHPLNPLHRCSGRSVQPTRAYNLGGITKSKATGVEPQKNDR